MQNNILDNIEIILGKLPSEPLVGPTFSSECLDFLNDIYFAIDTDKSLNGFTDLKAFGFWCRYANQKKIAARYARQFRSVGRGIALHICPSNVALNFAYSLAFGLLSGNQNIVRLPSRNFVQVQVLVSLIKIIPI